MRKKRSNVSPADLSRAQRWPIGRPVTVRKDDGELVPTRTRSAPWALGDHATWVILLEGISGGYDLSRVAERES